MADKRNELTKAAGITADVVMELGAYFSAQDMRKVQTGLTTAARELRALTHHSSLLGRLGEKLSHEQRELLTNAAALLDSVKYNVEHAKERKARVEKAEAKKRQQWEREAEQLVKTHFSLPNDTVAEQLRILELYLVAQAVLGQTIYLKDHLQLRKAMQEEPPRWSNHTAAQWRQSEVSSLMADMQSAIRYYLSWELSITPVKRLEEVQHNLEARRAEVLAKPQSVETLRIWTDALKGAAFITNVMPSGSPSR
ncbi:hypothetical protein [Pseudomonas baetica]|uniref:hypothetical protein n=1 Tax=Pseudomonas baetica TaxID=674054 RepID=UPI0024077635|nr:hypothetical protein [Pseudomonas baetica]MDF9778945.1 hypothetical protein [Pseudomonas baetica]